MRKLSALFRTSPWKARRDVAPTRDLKDLEISQLREINTTLLSALGYVANAN